MHEWVSSQRHDLYAQLPCQFFFIDVQQAFVFSSKRVKEKDKWKILQRMFWTIFKGNGVGDEWKSIFLNQKYNISRVCELHWLFCLRNCRFNELKWKIRAFQRREFLVAVGSTRKSGLNHWERQNIRKLKREAKLIVQQIIFPRHNLKVIMSNHFFGILNFYFPWKHALNEKTIKLHFFPHFQAINTRAKVVHINYVLFICIRFSLEFLFSFHLAGFEVYVLEMPHSLRRLFIN